MSLCYVKRTGSDLGDPNTGTSDGTLQWYNLMRGVRPRPEYPAGNPPRDPTGAPTRYTVTGDPLGPSGWVDGVELPPGDRRLWLAAGPFSMALGDTVDVVVGPIGALGASRLSSVSRLIQHDRWAQMAVDGEAATPAPAPAVVPTRLVLQPAYPNPFNPSTVLTLDVDRPQRVRVAVFDLLGRRVAVLHDGVLEAASHRLAFDARGLPGGTYLVRAAGETGTAVRRVVLAK